MRDDDPDAIGVKAFDKGDSTGCVGVRVSPRILQGLMKIFQSLDAVRGPHQHVKAQPPCVALGPVASLDEVQLEASGGQKKSRIPLGEQGYFTAEQVTVERHGPVQFGHEQDR